jgi:hypothetical protein
MRHNNTYILPDERSELRAIWSCRKPRSYRRRNISSIFRMDTCSWATKSPPRSVEELPPPVVQRRRLHETFFRKSFRHVNNVSDPASFFIHFPPESLFTSPESLFRIYRNALFTSPGIRRLVLHLSQSWGGLKTRTPLLDNIFAWQFPTSPKLEPVTAT